MALSILDVMTMKTFNRIIMKKFIYSFAALIAAASVLSCQKEPVEVNTENEGEFVYQFNVASAETKALLAEDATGTYTKFELNDALGIYTQKVSTPEHEISYNRYGKIDVTDGQHAEFNVYSHYALTTGDFVYAYFPYVRNNSEDPTNIALEIPLKQDGKMNAMPMVAVPFTVPTDVSVNTHTPVGTIYTQNLGGVFQFRIFSSNGSYRTETVKSVEFTSATDIAGSFTFDITQNSNLEISGNEGKSITVTMDAEVGSDKSNGGVVNMVVKPGSYTGTLVVTTNAAAYTFNITSAKSVERSHIKPLNVDLANAARQDISGTAFVKVQSDLSDWSGHYLIVFENTEDDKYYAFNSSLEILDAANNGVEVTLNSDGSIALDENTAGYVFTVASMDGGYSIKASNGKYICGTKDSNKLNENNNPSANTFTWDSSENCLQVAAPTFLTYNNASGQYRFRYMKTDNKNTAFYKLNGNFNPDFPTLTVVDQEVAGSYINVSVPVLSNRNWTAEITSGAEFVDGGELTTASGSGDGNITFKFAAANDSYFETQEVTLRVTAETKVVDITITHKTKTGVNLQINGQTSVDADATQYVANITANFPEWTVLAYSIDGVAQATSGENCVRTYDAEAGTGAVTLKFPSNKATTEATAAKSIVLTVGYGEYISRTITITQDGDEPEGGDTDGWVKTDLANINSGDVFVMVSGTYAIPNDADATPSAVQVTILGSKITSTVPANLKWNVTGNATDGYTFRPNGDSSKALYINTTNDSGSNTCVRIGAPASGVNRNVFVYDSKTLKTKDNTTKARYINLYNNSDWRGYVSNSTSTELVFYVLNDSRTAQPDFGFSSDKASYDLYTQVGSYPTLNGALTTVTYTSSDQSVATVDADGTVHPLKEGTTVITASTSDDDPTYKPASDSYTLTITDSTPSTGGDVEVLREEFDNDSTSDSSSAITNSTFSNFNGETSKAYKSQYGGIKFGTGSANGYITSKTLDLSNSFTVKLNARKYGSDAGKIQVTVGSTTKEITPTGDDTEYTLDFNAATSSSSVKIGTSAKRAYIDNVVIIRHD